MLPAGETTQNAATIAQQAVTPPVAPPAQPAATPAAPAPAAEAVPGSEAPVVNTSFANEDAELAEAIRKQAELDKSAGTTGTPGAAAPAAGSAATPAAAATTAPAGPAASPSQGAAPAAGATAQAQAASTNSQTGALIALRRKAQEERDARLVAEGRAQALEAVVRQGNSGQPGEQPGQQNAEPTIAEQRAAIDDDIVALATQYEEGKLTASEWKRQEMALTRERDGLVIMEAAETAAQHGGTSNANVNDLGLEQHLTRLVTAFPVLSKLTAADLEPFYGLAYRRAAMEGVQIPDTAQGTVMLRERMAALAEEFYDPAASARRRAGAGGTAPAAGAPAGGTTAGGAAPAGGARPTAAQREAKLQQAASAPPDISTLGSGATAGEHSEAQVASMFAGMNEDQQLSWLQANPGFVSKVMGGRTQR